MNSTPQTTARQITASRSDDDALDRWLSGVDADDRDELHADPVIRWLFGAGVVPEELDRPRHHRVMPHHAAKRGPSRAKPATKINPSQHVVTPETRRRVIALVEERSLHGAAQLLGSSREVLARVIAGLGVRKGSALVIEAGLAALDTEGGGA